MKILLRRFSGESITLADAAPVSGATCVATVALVDGASPATEDAADQATPTLLYEVTLAGGAVVRPVDWRRFAYSDEAVRHLVGVCVRDNLTQFAFMPNTGSTFDAVSNCLGVALGDLQSIADIRSIDCRADGFRRMVEVRYETKNGTSHELVVAQAGM